MNDETNQRDPFGEPTGGTSERTGDLGSSGEASGPGHFAPPPRPTFGIGATP